MPSCSVAKRATIRETALGNCGSFIAVVRMALAHPGIAEGDLDGIARTGISHRPDGFRHAGHLITQTRTLTWPFSGLENGTRARVSHSRLVELGSAAHLLITTFRLFGTAPGTRCALPMIPALCHPAFEDRFFGFGDRYIRHEGIKYTWFHLGSDALHFPHVGVTVFGSLLYTHTEIYP